MNYTTGFKVKKSKTCKGYILQTGGVKSFNVEVNLYQEMYFKQNQKTDIPSWRTSYSTGM